MRCMMHNARCAVVCLLLAVILVSCEQNELCYDHSHVVSLDVRFDWSGAPEAAPKTMSLYLFPREGGEALRYDFVGQAGGTIRVPRGEYDAICLNSDTRNIRLEGTHSHSAFEIYTDEADLFSGLTNSLGILSTGAPRAQGTDGQPVVLQPENVWAASGTGFVLDGEISPTKSRLEASLTLCPQSIVETYTVTITGVENIRHLQGISASLSDMAGGHHPASGTVSDRAVTLPFDMEIDRGAATVRGRLLTFGHCPADAGRRHHLMIYAVMTDGSRYYFDMDVSDALHSAPPSADGSSAISLDIDGLALPEPEGGGGGGLIPSIDDWRTINIDLEM